MAEMEKSQRYHEEGDSGGRKVSRSVPRVSCSVFAGLYSIVTEPCLLLSTSGPLGFQSHTNDSATEHTHSAGDCRESLN